MACDLSQWARARAPKVVRAKSCADALPMADNHKGKAVPFPYLDRAAYKEHFTNRQINEAIEKAPIKSVPLTGLHAIQHSVKASKVKDYISEPDAVPKGARDPKHKGLVDYPIVIEWDGKRFIHDGHHRLTALKLSGKKAAKMRLVSLGG